MTKDLRNLKMFKSWEVEQVVNNNNSTKETVKIRPLYQDLDIMRNLLRAELSSYVLDDLAEFAANPEDTIIKYSFSQFDYIDDTETTCMNEYINVFANRDSVPVELGWFMVLDEFKQEIELVLNSITENGLIVQTSDFEERTIDDLTFTLPIVKVGFIKKGGK